MSFDSSLYMTCKRHMAAAHSLPFLHDYEAFSAQESRASSWGIPFVDSQNLCYLLISHNSSEKKIACDVEIALFWPIYIHVMKTLISIEINYSVSPLELLIA